MSYEYDPSLKKVKRASRTHLTEFFNGPIMQLSFLQSIYYANEGASSSLGNVYSYVAKFYYILTYFPYS
jgi:hypothetical protein